MNERIIVMGGSFNPPTIAHQRLGRYVQLRPNWENVKLPIMEEICRKLVENGLVG